MSLANIFRRTFQASLLIYFLIVLAIVSGDAWNKKLLAWGLMDTGIPMYIFYFVTGVIAYNIISFIFSDTKNKKDGTQEFSMVEKPKGTEVKKDGKKN